MLCAFRMVDKRWAMMRTVKSPRASMPSIADCTWNSDSASSAEVASSNSSTLGLLTSARAMATRCLCPPDSCAPRSPTCVW
mmetsp:Transcript_39384/g.79528  ORF Transcript_39384/g.79528 Transcript_39384/m.79528 type:complete len:81 (-) Transcript_39384:85-327(-)